MRFQPVKCNMMQLTRKPTKKSNAEYTSEGTVLQNVDKIKYPKSKKYRGFEMEYIF